MRLRLVLGGVGALGICCAALGIKKGYGPLTMDYGLQFPTTSTIPIAIGTTTTTSPPLLLNIVKIKY